MGWELRGFLARNAASDHSISQTSTLVKSGSCCAPKETRTSECHNITPHLCSSHSELHSPETVGCAELPLSMAMESFHLPMGP